MPNLWHTDAVTFLLSPVRIFVSTERFCNFLNASFADFLGTSKKARYPIKIKSFSSSTVILFLSR